jgi:hypothetical protein
MSACGAVLAVAREEFAQHGYVEAKFDRIAERAELTRGAVYELLEQARALAGGACRHGGAQRRRSGHLAETAPGFGDPFDVARACEHVAGIDLADTGARRICRT